MNIFDAHISGSLSVSASAEFSGNITVLGTVSGSFQGDGTNITNIPASGVTGLNLTQIADGNSTASISQTNGFRVNNNTEITGTLKVTGNIDGAANFNTLRNLPTLVSGSSQLTSSYDTRYVLSGSITQTTWDNIASKPDGIVSGSVQVQLTDTTGYSTFSSSIASINSTQDSRLNSIETASGSIRNDFNSYTSSNDSTNTTQNGRLTSLESSTGSLNAFTSSTNGRISSIETESSSIRTNFNSYTSSNDSTNTTQNSRLNSIESSTGSINTFTSSINTTIKNKLNSESVISGSIQVDITSTTGYSTFSSSISSSFGSLSSSLSTTNDTQNGRLNSIESTTSSLNTFSSSINTTIKEKLNTESVISGSAQVTISSTTGYSTFSSSISTSIGDLSSSIATTTSGLSSTITSLSSSLTSSIGTISSSINTSIGNLSSSVATTTNTLSSSIASTNLSQDNRLTTIEGRYATTGSNQFNGNQTITGSLIITQNLQVLGSSSITYSTSSQMIVEDNVIVVNASTPAERFAGIQVYDSGSNGSITASLFWDGLNNRWIYQNSSEAHYGGAMFIAGPRNTGSLGDETTLTNGKIPKSIGGDHIGDSIITEFSGSIAISGSLIVTGSILSTSTSLVSGSSQVSFNGITDKPSLISGSSQVDHNATTNYDSNKHIDHTAVSITAGAGLTGGGDISSTRTINVGAGNGITVNADDIAIDTSSATFTTGVKSKLNNDTVHSGSYLGTATTANLSENTNLYYTDARVKTKLSAEGVISGSAQVTGIGNSQLTNSSITIAGTSTSLGGSISAATIGNAIGAFSGSAQVSGLSNSQLTNSSITIGSTSTSLGGTSTSLAGLTSVTSTAFTGSIQGYATSETLATVTGRGASTTNKLTVTASGTGGSPLLSLSVSNAASFVHGQETFAANLTSGQAVINPIGVSGSTKNAGYIGYKYSGTGGSNDNLLTFGHWGADHLMTMNGAGNVSITGTVTASNLSGTNTGDQTNITGNAGTVTNGLYTTGDQTITGQKTFPSEIANRPILSGGFLSTATGDLDVDIWGISEDYYPSHATSANAWGLRWYGTGNEFRFVGGGTNRVIMDMDDGNITTTGTITASGGNSSNWNTAYGWGNHASAGYQTTSGTVAYATYLNALNNYVWAASTTPTSFHQGLTTSFVQGSDGFQSYGSVMTMRTYSGGGGSLQMYVPYSPTYGGVNLQVRFGNYDVSSGNSWTSWKIIANKYSTTFSSVTSVTVTHNLGTKDVAVFVYDGSDNMFWPSSIVTTSTSVVTITFASSRSGRVVVIG